MSNPLPWQAHTAPGYDSVMATCCSALLDEIVSDPSRRRAILADPRDLHRELFAPFVPPGHADYAGGYRGTSGTALTGRRISAESQLEFLARITPGWAVTRSMSARCRQSGSRGLRTSDICLIRISRLLGFSDP